jgi:hypothetical protein
MDRKNTTAPGQPEPPSQPARSLVSAILNLGPYIRYAAVCGADGIETQERAGLQGGSSASSDFYEELLVNPTILGLASRRGNLDCGGLRHVVVGYGLFNQVVVPMPDGHLSVAVELDVDPQSVIEALTPLVEAVTTTAD